MCHVTEKSNLVQQTSFETRDSDYIPYVKDIKTVLSEQAKLHNTTIGRDLELVPPSRNLHRLGHG